MLVPHFNASFLLGLFRPRQASLVLVLVPLLLTACSNVTRSTDRPDPNDPGSIFTGRSERGIAIADLFDPGVSGGGGGLPVNAILWRAALDTVSVIPIDDIDTFGGTILTEWYPHPDQSNQRIKVAAFVIDRELRSDAIRVNVYLQSQQGGSWVDAGQDPELAHRLEDLILTRAREIRAAATGAIESN